MEGHNNWRESPDKEDLIRPAAFHLKYLEMRCLGSGSRRYNEIWEFVKSDSCNDSGE